jgi:hypothetical protein
MPDTPAQCREPTAADVEHRFPLWKTATDVPGWPFYARRTQGAALSARGDSWQDVIDAITAAETRLSATRPPGWPVPRDPRPVQSQGGQEPPERDS